MMTKKSIYDDASLIKKSLLKDLSKEEEQKLEQLLADGRLAEAYEQLRDPACLKEQFAEYGNYSAQKGYAVFKKKRGPGKRAKMVRWVAAVAAICVISLGITWWQLPGGSGSTGPLPLASDGIHPETGQVRLTLADGTVVIVSDKNTQALKEEGVNIECSNGNIAYRTEATAAANVYNQLAVPRGGECVITLADGTKVWVNAESSLKYPVAFAGEKREVILEGEAFFDVVKSEHPFIVKTSFGDVRVLGTEFGITAYAGSRESYTTLVRGRVRVETDGAAPVTILPGEQVVTSTDGKMLRRQVDVNEFVGWKDGIYLFRNKKLGDIINTLERWYNISVSFESDGLKELLFTGDLNRYDDINVFFDALSRTEDVKYRVENNHVILYK